MRLLLFMLSAAWTWVAPAITRAAVSIILRSEITSSRDRNVTRVLARRVHVLGNVTTHSEALVHRENQVCFHSRSSFRSKATVPTENALRVDWLLLCKNCLGEKRLFRSPRKIR